MKRFTMIAALLLLAVLLVLGASSAASVPIPAKNPLGGLERGPPGAAPLRGRVERRIVAGSYTYLALRADDKTLHWTVTLGRGAPEGTRIAVRSVGRSPRFHSRRLNRTFDDLLFGFVTLLD